MKQQQEELKKLKNLDNITFYGELNLYKEQIANIASNNIKLICNLLKNRNNQDLKEDMKRIANDLYYLRFPENKKCDKDLLQSLLDASKTWENDQVFQKYKNNVWNNLKIYLESDKTNSCDQQSKELQKIYG